MKQKEKTERSYKLILVYTALVQRNINVDQFSLQKARMSQIFSRIGSPCRVKWNNSRDNRSRVGMAARPLRYEGRDAWIAGDAVRRRLLSSTCPSRSCDYLLGALECRRERGALTEVLRRSDRWIVTHVGAWSWDGVE